MVWDREIGDWDEGPIQGILNEWNSGRHSKAFYVYMFLTRIATITFPYRGFRGAHASMRKYGLQTWWAPHNLWRQVWHMLSTSFLALVLFIPKIAFPALFAFILALFHEWRDIKGEFKNIRVKNILDIIFWVLGASLGTWGLIRVMA